MSVGICVLADYLDRIFVSAHRAVRTESVEDGPKDVLFFDRKGCIAFQTRLGDVVADANGKMIFGRRVLQIVQHRFDHCRSNSLDDRPYLPPTIRRSFLPPSSTA